LVEDARPARAGARLASCRDEACLGKDPKVRTDGVDVQTDARSQLAGVERRLSLLDDFEDLYAAWVAQGAVEFGIEFSGCLARRLRHDQILSTLRVLI
jgi:hypothetical protein